MAPSWKQIIIGPKIKLGIAITQMNKTGNQTLLVCDESLKLLGTVSDGDIRKALIVGKTMDTCISEIMNPKPITIGEETQHREIIDIFLKNRFQTVPIVSNGHLIGCKYIDDFIGAELRSIPMVIMAGGFGRRLGELTKTTPKPLLEIRGKPIIRHILDNAIDRGITQFFISVHYLAENIKHCLGDGSKFGVKIEYLDEDTPLGTAGGLQKLPNLSGPIIISNGDIISKINYKKLIQHHLSNDAKATMVVYENTIQNPFGVVLTDGININGFDEKPVWRSLINAGIYVLDGESLKYISMKERIDMPDLIMRLKSVSKKVIIYQFEDEWFDVGNLDDYKKLNA